MIAGITSGYEGRMRHTPLLIALLVVAACKKKEGEAPPPSAAPTAPGTPAAAPTPPTPTPAPPPPTPVQLTEEQLRPTCAKIVTAELAAKTHGATKVEDKSVASLPRGAICALFKGDEQVGMITIACDPNLDPTAIERERAAMTKAKDLSPPVGRGGYRISSMVIFNDDETPCRLHIGFGEIAEDKWPDALRAIAAAVNPDTLKK